MLQGIDISNLQGAPESYRHLDWYVRAAFVIVRASGVAEVSKADVIDAQAGKRAAYPAAQLRAAVEDGKKVGAYAWLWNGLADTRGNILARFATVPPSVTLDMRPWVDVEDTTGGAGIMAEQHADWVAGAQRSAASTRERAARRAQMT